MYSLRKIHYATTSQAPTLHYHVMEDGIKPVAILTDEYSDVKDGDKSTWIVILLKNNAIHDLFDGSVITAKDALNIINQCMQGNSIKGLGTDPDCMLRYITEFGMRLYRADIREDAPFFYSKGKGQRAVFSQSLSKKYLKEDAPNDALPLAGDRVIEKQIILKSTNEIVAFSKMKIDTPTFFNDTADIWPDPEFLKQARKRKA